VSSTASPHSLSSRSHRTDVASPGVSFVTWTLSLMIAFALMFFVATTVTLSSTLIVLVMLAISAVTRFALGALVRA
jgi:hypothetical protein